MALIKGGKVVTDRWVTVGNDVEPPTDGPIIVTLERWRRERDRLIARGGQLGVRLAADSSPAEIRDDLSRFDLIALEFPVFRDGRAYSYARLLRERYRFDGELRAVGNVLRDQFLFMHRCGFDAFDVSKTEDLPGWHQAITEFSYWYQPATDTRVPVWRLRHRQPAAAE